MRLLDLRLAGLAYGSGSSRFSRRFLARVQLKKMRQARDAARRIQRNFRASRHRRREWAAERQRKAAVLIQKTFRRQYWRSYYISVYRDYLRRERASRVIAKRLRLLFLRWRVKKAYLKERAAKKGPRRRDSWKEVMSEAGQPLRSFMVFDEYKHPHQPELKFYCNRITGECTLEKPREWMQQDMLDYEVSHLRRTCSPMR